MKFYIWFPLSEQISCRRYGPAKCSLCTRWRTRAFRLLGDDAAISRWRLDLPLACRRRCPADGRVTPWMFVETVDLQFACRRRCPADGRLTMFADYVCLPSDCSRVCRLLADTTLQSLVDAMNLLMASLSGTFWYHVLLLINVINE
jgi:hypothetical protein